MHRLERLIVLIAAAALLATGAHLFLAASGRTVAAADGRERPVSSPARLTLGSDDETRGWTLERMARARPLPSLRDRRRPRVTASDEVGRKPRAVAGELVPQERSGAVVTPSFDQPPLDYPFPFGRRYVERELGRVGPYRAIGRVFFRRGGVDYACSAASVVGGRRHVVFTAGHCLHAGGTGQDAGWSKDVVFVPGRRAGRQRNPYGQFHAQVLWVPEGWSDSGDWAYDLGAFDVRKGSRGKKLRKAVGALGFAYDQGRIQHWDVFGYAAVAPFAGDRLATCSAQHAIDDGSAGEDPIGIGCDLSNGSEGGPWIMSLRRGNYLNGVTSYGYASMPAARFSPYFGTAANNLRCAAGTGDEATTSC